MKDSATKNYVIIIALVFAIMVWVMVSFFNYQQDQRIKQIECSLWEDCVEQRPIKVTKNNVDLEGYHSECIEDEVVERTRFIKEYDFCHDICTFSYRCSKFAKEHNITSTTKEPYINPHERNPISIFNDFCDLNTEEQWNECLDMCQQNYYYDELEIIWNETICTKERLVRLN